MATANLLQTSVSGGTQNALSLQGDGVFFPKASTTSRLALTLTTTDKGFIVYDTTDNNIYFWNGAAWESVPSSGDAGANGSVQYNDNGIVSGATNFTYDKATGNVGIGASPASYGGTYRTLAVNATDAGILDLMSNSVSQFRIFGNGVENRLGGITNVPLTFHTNNSEKMQISALGNVGIGVTPSAWQASWKALDISTIASVWGNINTSIISNNIFFDGALKYKTALVASYLQQQSKTFQFFQSSDAIPVAGGAASFTQAMTLDASGNLLVGTTVAPAGTKIGAIAKLSGVSLEGTAAINVSTTPVPLGKSMGTGGLYFVTGFNTTGGNQGWWLVASNGGSAPTVIANNNTTGLVVAFTTVSGVLNMNTTAGTIQVNVFGVSN